MARKFFRHGELPLVVLALLGRRPMHGYELMHELGQLFGPEYRPSAGSIYPALLALEAEGLVEGREDGGRRVLEVTRVGSEALERRMEALDALEVRTGVRLAHRPGVDAAMARFGTRVRAAAPRIDLQELDELLEAAATEIEGRAARGTPSPR